MDLKRLRSIKAQVVIKATLFLTVMYLILEAINYYYYYLFSGKIMQMPVCTWTFLLKIGATNHPGKGLDPLPQTGNSQMNRDFFMVGLP